MFLRKRGWWKWRKW